MFNVLNSGQNGEEAVRLYFRLREIREQQGMTRQELSEGSGIPWEVISLLEERGVNWVRTTTLVKLADALDVGVERFFCNP